MQLLLYWLHACLDLFCIMQKSTKSKINLWHSKNHISNQIRIWIWLIRWKSWFSISVPRKWEVTAARESPGNVTFFLCIQDFQSKKFTWKEGIVLPWCSPGICQAHSSVFAEQHSTPELCTCCTARAQPAGTEHCFRNIAVLLLVLSLHGLPKPFLPQLPWSCHGLFKTLPNLLPSEVKCF